MLLNLKKLSVAVGLAAMMLVPVVAKADSVGLNLNLGADDEAHYHFNDQGHHHSEIWKAAKQLRDAKHRIWIARGHVNFGGHAESAIQAINGALDELRAAEEFVHSR